MRNRRDLRCPRRSPGTAVFAITTAAVTPVGAQSQGPNSPSTVVNDPSIGATPWMNPQDAAVSDNIEALYGNVLGGTSYYLKGTGFGFAIPNGAVIEGVQVAVERQGTFPIHDIAARIVKGGAIGTTDKSIPIPNFWTFPDNVVTYGGSTDLWGETWTAADINDPNFGFALAVFDADSFAFVDAMSITVFYTSPTCGNGVLDDPGEQCDDGNTANGDCCSATCQLDPPGFPCADNTACNGDETCDGAGVCQPGMALDCDDHKLCTQDSCDPISGCVNDGSPLGGCRTALKSILVLKNKSPDTKDKLVWKWVKGQSTTQSEFGTPTGTTQYALCIHAGTAAALLARYNVPGDAMKWSPIATKGYQYSDSAGSAAGVTKVLLKGSPQNKAKCLVKGKGSNLADFDLTTLVDPVTVQLVNSANTTCFESTFNQADFIKFNDPVQFKAKAQ